MHGGNCLGKTKHLRVLIVLLLSALEIPTTSAPPKMEWGRKGAESQVLSQDWD